MALEDVLEDILDRTPGGTVAIESDLVAPTQTTMIPSLDGILEKIERCDRDRIALESFSVMDNCTKSIAMEVFTMIGNMNTEKIISRLTAAPSRHNSTLIASAAAAEIGRVDEQRKALCYDIMMVRDELSKQLNTHRPKVVALAELVERIVTLCRNGVRGVIKRNTIDLTREALTVIAYYDDSLYSYPPFEDKLRSTANKLVDSCVYKNTFTETSSLYDVALKLTEIIGESDRIQQEGSVESEVCALRKCRELLDILNAGTETFIHPLEVLTDVLSS